VYSAVGSVITTEWPVGEVVIKRRRVPRLDDPSKDRVINSLSLYGSNEITPAVPGDDNWDGDWTRLFTQNNNNDLLNIHWISADEVRYKHYLVAIQSMSDETQGRVNELELLVHSDFADGTITNTTGAQLISYLIQTMGTSIGSIVSTVFGGMQIGSFSTDGSSYYSVISDLAVRTGNVVICDPLSNISIFQNPNWTTADIATVIETFTRASISNIDIEQRDDLSISQVQVQVQDQDGNITVGVWPPVARNDGSVYKEPTLYSADTSIASQIARWLIQEKTSAVITANLSGVAPWALGGWQVIELDWLEDSGFAIEGLWVIRSTEHKFNFGSSVVQPSWTTNLLLHRKI
jgi:hypothetical protein